MTDFQKLLIDKMGVMKRPIFARKINVNLKTLESWLIGTRHPNHASVKKVVKALGGSVEFVFPAKEQAK